MKKYIIPLVAISSITIIEVIALFHGVDGTILGLSLTVIGGICGYEIRSLRR